MTASRFEAPDHPCPCPACARPNRAARGFCGGCGAPLRPLCRGCRFLNDAGDCFCGGCGNMLVADVRGPAPVPAPGSARPVNTPPPTQWAVNDELEALFSPVVADVPAEELPSHGITQDNLDQFFASPT